MYDQDQTVARDTGTKIVPGPMIYPLDSAAGRQAVAEVDQAALVTASIGGVGLAGASYAIFVSGLCALFSSIPIGGVNWIVILPFVGLLGMMLALFLATVMALLVHGVRLSISVTLDQPMFGALIGGLSGYFAWTGAINGEPTHNLGFLLVGPSLATLFGQIGGAVGGAGYLEPAKHMRLGSGIPGPVKVKTRPRFQFGLRQLLIITAWCCALTTFLKVIGCSPAGFVFIVIGIAVQVPMYLLGRYLWRHVASAYAKQQVSLPCAVID